MKPISMLLLMSVALPALAGQVIVNQGMSTADTFALRDQLAREHEWQEWLRLQQAVKWLEVLPVNCELVGGRGEDYHCGDSYYRPYRQNGRDIYIQGDPPGLTPGHQPRANKKAP
ncbi:MULTISPECIES: hypothetical protein [Aeromonas]|jgi:hypothetical protein|uniref:Periplasmic protein n=1 Tax=Aeromonas encheleia TaxID=73010 RepID=A0AAE9MFX8_9GAMM|nr:MULTISPECIES: hypothetical protein [Aeromonas]MBV7416681.1 hypothetical protein [Aeromonas sp. sif2433]MBV7438054.1 hypothetical protein [Aeromonas sp. sif2416]UNP89081.1 hypothetical protein MNZ22_00765 [Aeromonas encheleia]USV56997.1 hypothetical protein NHF51_16890 [Aeromonas encheleia]